MWGTYVESELREATTDYDSKQAAEAAKVKRKLERAIELIFGEDEEVDGKPQPGRFRDPAAMLKRGQ